MKAEAPLRKLAAITIWEAVGTLVSTDEERRRDEQMVMMEKLESFRAFPESCHYRVGFIILLDTFWIPTTEVTHMLESLLKTLWTLSTNDIFLFSLFRIICVVCLQNHKNNHQDLTRAPRGREGRATGILGSMNDWNFCLTTEAICLLTVKAQRWIHGTM